MQHRPLQVAHSQQQLEPRPPTTRLEVIRRRLSSFYARFHKMLLVGAGILIALISMFLYDATRPLPQQLTQSDIDAAVERALESAASKPFFAAQAYEIIRPSLVRVEALVMEAGAETEGALGTGVVIEDSGIILTSLHVVQDAVAVKVVFADGSESAASVIGGQPENDLAVLRAEIIPDDLEPATITSSATLLVGDEVVAVGNPFGISNSLSAGVVSGLGRSFRLPGTGITLTNLIQFDAAVNPGNSGGLLVNRDGEVVGIITALLNPTDQEFFIGIGFAVPIETAVAALGSPPY